jgi:glutathione S-transferase
MKLYTFDAAPNARRLGLFLNYKGLEIDTQQLDMAAEEQLGEAYAAINPQQTVPALVLDDGTVLSEVIGICTYLEALHPDKPLLGSTALEKAQIISWDHRLFNTIMAAVAMILRNTRPGFKNRALPGPIDVPQIPELGERGRLLLKHLLPDLDAHLAKQSWVAGDKLSFADIDLLVAIDFCGWVKEGIPEQCSHLKAWYERAAAELT